MVKKQYVPARGDIVWLNFNPQSGHGTDTKPRSGAGSPLAQSGKRPALVLSPKEYNEKTGLGLFCPITSKVKDYPFEVKIDNSQIKGVILSDQIKSMDWRSRAIEFILKGTTETINEVINKISVLLYA